METTHDEPQVAVEDEQAMEQAAEAEEEEERGTRTLPAELLPVCRGMYYV